MLETMFSGLKRRNLAFAPNFADSGARCAFSESGWVSEGGSSAVGEPFAGGIVHNLKTTSGKMSSSAWRKRFFVRWASVLAIAVAAALSLFMGPPARAELIWNAISINFTNSSNLLAANEVAGNATEGSFANWNNMTSGTSLNSLNWALNPDGWTAPTVNLSIYTGSTPPPYASPAPWGGQNGSNGWSGGVSILGAATAPTSANSSNNKLYAAGANGNSTNGPAGIWQNNTFFLEGLNTAFPNGYKVYVYQSAGTGNNTGASNFAPGMNASGTTGGTRDFGSGTFLSPASGNVALTFGTPGTTQWGQANNAAFDGTFANGKFFTITKTGGGLITSDVFALNNSVYGTLTGVTTNQLVNGIQIVGQVEVVPEPMVLGAAGVVGLAVMIAMRRARRAARAKAALTDRTDS